MSERQQAEMLLDNIPEQSLHIVIALMRELTEYEDYIECALDEADYLAEHTTERMTHEEVFSDLRRSLNDEGVRRGRFFPDHWSARDAPLPQSGPGGRWSGGDGSFRTTVPPGPFFVFRASGWYD